MVIEKNDCKNSRKKENVYHKQDAHCFLCTWISVVCASDLLPATQGPPDSQTSLNYSRVPIQKKQCSRYQTGNTYRNWLDYFCHSSTAAHSTWRLLIGWVAWKPGSPHPSKWECVHMFSCAQIVLQNCVSVNNHCSLFVKERQRDRKTNRGTESVSDIQTNCPVLTSTPELLKITPTRKDTSLRLCLSLRLQKLIFIMCYTNIAADLTF